MTAMIQKKKFKCLNCGFKNKTFEEKESDVRVATGMLTDVFTKRCDVTVIVSADSGMIPSVEIIKSFAPEHPVIAYIPPNQKSFALVNKCDAVLWMELPEDVTLENGHVIHRPTNWR